LRSPYQTPNLLLVEPEPPALVHDDHAAKGLIFDDSFVLGCAAVIRDVSATLATQR
jgi:hypothetical protein